MRIRFHRPWLALSLALATGGVVRAQAQAANDACANAQIVGPSTYLQIHTTAGANPDGSASCGGAAPDVWYALTAAFDGTLDLLMVAWPQSSAIDPLLSVHSGCPGTVVNELACNDDFDASHRARVHLSVARGQTYWIRATGANGTSGSFNLEVDGPIAPIPFEDDSARAITIGPGTYAGDTYEATAAPLGPSGCSSGLDVWYRYVPAQSGVAISDTCTGTLDDTVLVVFQGTTPVGCSDDACGPSSKHLQSRVTWNASAGVEYTIGVSEYYGGQIPFELHLSGPPRADDDCPGALAVGPGTYAFQFGNATADGSSSCSAASEPDVYYAFTAPTDGRLSVSTCGTDDFEGLDLGEDTLISLHAGCPASAGNQLACNDGASPACADDQSTAVDARASADVISGQTVIVRVTRTGAATSASAILVHVDFEPGTTFCAGDGSAAACPCGNFGAAGRGCANSRQVGGARLDASGSASVANDTLTLHASGMPSSAIALYAQGTQKVAGGAGIVFGDGLRCVGVAVVRLGLRASTVGASRFGALDGTGAHVSIAGALPAGGGTRHYQVWYRDAANFCTPATYGLSNGLTLSWPP